MPDRPAPENRARVCTLVQMRSSMSMKRLGFEVTRIRGSHQYLRHSADRATVVPVHGSEVIGSGLLAKILRDAELTAAVLKRRRNYPAPFARSMVVDFDAWRASGKAMK